MLHPPLALAVPLASWFPLNNLWRAKDFLRDLGSTVYYLRLLTVHRD
jgi:hypothetical protein